MIFPEVKWRTPSRDAAGSMPLGNGEIALNVWVGAGGDLLFYLAKSDAWNENGRLLKLGRVRVQLSPPLQAGADFSQTLDLERGAIEVRFDGAQQTVLRIWADANAPVVRLEVESSAPLDLRVSLEVWRERERALAGVELHSAYGLAQGPQPVIETPDQILRAENAIVWCHRNESSRWPESLDLQGLSEIKNQADDPLLHRTFGALICGDNLLSEDEQTLVSARAQQRFVVEVFPLTAQTANLEAWQDRLREQAAALQAADLEASRAAHEGWWREFWARSCIEVSGSPEAETVHRGYVLQRFIAACAGRGSFPIKFNGSLFTVEMREDGIGGAENSGACFDADYRRWGGLYWFQNTRLVYWPMLAAGDFDLLAPLFKMFVEALPLAQARTQQYFGHGGACFPETMTFWGAYANSDYGWDRSGKPVSHCDNEYIRHYFQGGLELCALALERFGFSPDAEFAARTLLPLARGVVQFYDEHYPRENGKLKLEPAQVLETWWQAENPTPDVAGLMWVLDGLLKLPPGLCKSDERESWRRLRAEVPELPTQTLDGKPVVADAAKTQGARRNSENGALYAVFPYPLFGVGAPDLEIGRDTFAARHEKSSGGWQQSAIQAACLGLGEEARREVVHNFSTSHRGSRFPAFWGPNADWVPDQDHGSVAMLALQKMLLQSCGATLYLFPAWPREWDVSFKLHAPQRTIVEGVYSAGKLQILHVTPPERLQNVVVLEPQAAR